MIEYNDGTGRWRTTREERDAERAVYAERCRVASNKSVFETYSTLSGGDDYDGCYTVGGGLMFEVAQEELLRRLKAIGFLEE